MTDSQIKQALKLREKIEELEKFLKTTQDSIIKTSTLKITWKVMSFWGRSKIIETPREVLDIVIREVEKEIFALKEELAYL